MNSFPSSLSEPIKKRGDSEGESYERERRRKFRPGLAASIAAYDDQVDMCGGVLHVQERQAQQDALRLLGVYINVYCQRGAG
jgi:hypothetical protein